MNFMELLPLIAAGGLTALTAGAAAPLLGAAAGGAATGAAAGAGLATGAAGAAIPGMEALAAYAPTAFGAAEAAGAGAGALAPGAILPGMEGLASYAPTAFGPEAAGMAAQPTLPASELGTQLMNPPSFAETIAPNMTQVPEPSLLKSAFDAARAGKNIYDAANPKHQPPAMPSGGNMSQPQQLPTDTAKKIQEALLKELMSGRRNALSQAILGR